MRTRILLRSGARSDARRLHARITANLEEGRLLPRSLEEVTVHAERFVVAVPGRTVVGCAALAPLSPQVAEDVKCPSFRRCGQFAMVLPLEPAADVERPAAIALRLA